MCVCRLAKERYVRIQKERDYHRMHHRRVVQEKDKLLTDLKRYTRPISSGYRVSLLMHSRMKDHYSTYEPVMQQLRHKYQVSSD